MENLTPYEIWKKVEKDKLSESEHKRLLVDNGILLINISENVDVCPNCKHPRSNNYDPDGSCESCGL